MFAFVADQMLSLAADGVPGPTFLNGQWRYQTEPCPGPAQIKDYPTPVRDSGFGSSLFWAAPPGQSGGSSSGDGVQNVRALLVGNQAAAGHIDVEAFFKLLKTTYNLPTTNITKLISWYEVNGVRTNIDIPKSDILDAIRQMQNSADGDDLLIVYFSCHGTRDHNEVHLETGRSDDLLEAGELTGVMSPTPCPTLLYVDACYSGAITEKFSTNYNVSTIAACSANDKAIYTYQTGAWMTEAFLNRARANPQGDWMQTARDAADEIRKQTARDKYVPRWQNETGVYQTPEVRDRGTKIGPKHDVKVRATTNPPFAERLYQVTMAFKFAYDPNEMVGPAGRGDEGFVPETAVLPYAVHFENLATATAAAQMVVVTNQLSAALDWSTFRLLGFGFNGEHIVVPDGAESESFSTTVSVGSDPNPVRVSASFDRASGLLTWTAWSVNPVTGGLVEDPLAGFLPPNDSGGRGEGYVTYSVRPKAGLGSGVQILNQARIVFDVNAPIDTPTVTNTLDVGTPSSSVSALPTEVGSTNFMVQWGGADDSGGSGIRDYSIFFSSNGGAFLPWLVTNATWAMFSGVESNTYSFYSIATDWVGHQEQAPAGADATTTIIVPDAIFVKPSGNDTNDGLSWATAVRTLQAGLDKAPAGKEIWVAEGTYRPNDVSGTTNREQWFELKEGVEVYGGFAGTEASREQRDPLARPTVLSGDIDGNDADNDHDGFSDPATMSNNCYHVIYNNAARLTSATVLDGFTIRGGYANGPCPHEYGGGILNFSCGPTIRNCVITQNRAKDHGGGMHNHSASPVIDGCAFTRNVTLANGGGMYNESSSSPPIDGSTFANNRAVAGGGICGSFAAPRVDRSILTNNEATFGGGIENAASWLWITRSTVAGNTAGERGGGIDCSSGTLDVINCTVANNVATNGAGIFMGDSSAGHLINATIADNAAVSSGGGIYMGAAPWAKNCILWGNSPAVQIHVTSGTPAVSNCVVQGGYAGGASIIDTDPDLEPLGDHGGPTPTRPPRAGSPAIDAGLTGENIPSDDQRGFARKAAPDIGSCEYRLLALTSDPANPVAIGAQPTLTVATDRQGPSFEWFAGPVGDESHPLGCGTNTTFTLPALGLGADFWVRVSGDGPTVKSEAYRLVVQGTYDQWVAFHGLSGQDAAPGACPGRDGVCNLIKFASGLDPHSPCGPEDYRTFAIDRAARTLTMTWIQSKTPTDLNWGFRQSTDLKAWSPVGTTPTVIDSDAACDMWQVTVPMTSSSLFLDVEVNRPAP